MNTAYRVGSKIIEQFKSLGPSQTLCVYFYDEILSTMDFSDHLASDAVQLQNGLIDVRHDLCPNYRELLNSGAYIAVMAGNQVSGRGRMGRKWERPLGTGFFLTVFCKEVENEFSKSGLSLALGVALRRALSHLGLHIFLKWPNDLVLFQESFCKVGGILVERKKHERYVACGVGLNIDSVPEQSFSQRYPAAALVELNHSVDLIEIASSVIVSICRTLEIFAKLGFVFFQKEWIEGAAMRGKEVRIDISGREIFGILLGVDKYGNLIIECEGKEKIISIGEVHAASN